MPRGPEPGSGRPRKGVVRKVAGSPKRQTPLEYMLAVIHDPEADVSRRDRMAMAAAPYLHAKKDYGSLKDQRDKAAKKTADGKFAATEMPVKLVVNSR
jgi:hypothetical protein